MTGDLASVDIILYMRVRGGPAPDGWKWHWRSDCPERQRYIDQRSTGEIEFAIRSSPPRPPCCRCGELSAGRQVSRADTALTRLA